MDVYAENILDHYREPRHQHTLDDADVEHEEINHSCGDAITLFIKVHDGKIADIGWQGTGCAISQAAMSMLCEELIGLSVDEAQDISKDEIFELLGVPIGARRMKCALLCLHTLKNALRTMQEKGEQTWVETVDLT